MWVGRRCGLVWVTAGVDGEWMSAYEDAMWVIVDVGGCG